MYSNQTSVITKNIQVPSSSTSSIIIPNNDHQIFHMAPSPSGSSVSSLSSSSSSKSPNGITSNTTNNHHLAHLYNNHPHSYFQIRQTSFEHGLPPCLYDCSSSMKNQTNNSKRRPIPVPNENKDKAYWERRRRNNESAKRSRESRRRKEIQTTQRIMYLEQENCKLQAEVQFLREEIIRLRENEFVQCLLKKII